MMHSGRERYGLAGIRMLHGRFPYIVLIKITGQGDELVATEAMKVGAMDYLSKNSVKAESVWRCVENAVEKANLQRTVNEQREELAKLADFMHSIISSSPFATIVTNLQRVITSVNPAAEHMLWYRREDLINLETPLLLLSPQQVANRAKTLSEELLSGVEPGTGVLTANPRLGRLEEAEWELIRRDRTCFDAQLTVSALTDAKGDIVGYILIAYDITERKRAQDYMTHLARHYELTRLPTRTLFRDQLDSALARAMRHQRQVGILMVDLDNFKKINDLLGHKVGDEVLIVVAERLQSCVRASDTVARTIPVNISPRQFQQNNLPQMIVKVLTESDLSPSSLELEFTENVLVDGLPRPRALLEQIRALGLRVAIDDFGTGFSSMSYVLRFRVDRLKIDQSFIREMAVDPDSHAVTNAVIALAKGIYIPVVAEGVETAVHRELLLGEGCDEAQGYFYSRPLPMDGIGDAINAIEHFEASTALA